MPIRRRDARDRLTFELVESDGDDVDVDDSRAARSPETEPGVEAATALGKGTEPDGPEATAVAASGARRGPGRKVTVAAVAAAVVLVLGGMLAVDAWQSRTDLALLRSAPGAVEPLLDAPRERWTADVGHGSGVSRLPATLVTIGDGEAVGRSLDTGDERWRAAVGEHATCGNWAQPAGEPERTLVCVAPVVEDGAGGPGAELTVDPTTGRVDASSWDVTVLDEDGSVLGRRETTVEGGAPFPGPGGTVVRAERVGEVPEGDGAEVELDDATGEPVALPTGRGAVVRVEDAVTGEARWEAELPFVDRSGECVSWEGSDGADPTVRAELENLWAVSQARLVMVQGCGVSAWFTPDGTRLDEVDNPRDGVVVLPDGTYYRDPTNGGYGWGYAATDDATASPAILGADGTVRWEPPGPVLVPSATDGRPAPVLVRDSLDLVAFDDAGTELWRSSEVGTPEAVHVAAGGTLVVANSSGGTFVGLDAATGREQWTFGREEVDAVLGGSAGSPWTIDGAYTDGARAIVSVTDWDATSVTSTLAALDLTDGHLVWVGEPMTGPDGSWTVSLQGRLLRIGETELVRLG